MPRQKVVIEQNCALGSSYPNQLASLGDLVFFNADDGVHGSELWRSDGTEAGTAIVADITGNFRGASPYGMVLANGRLHFIADRPDVGQELFTLDVAFPPLAPEQTFTRAPGVSLKIRKADVLAACSDPDGDGLSLQSIGPSAQGATLGETATHILYTPANDRDDSFSYVVSDGQGGTATGVVHIRVVSPGGLVQSVSGEGGVLTVKFAGLPGYTYSVQRAPNLDGPWSTVDTQTAPPLGLFEFTDPSPPSPMAFYRLIHP